MMHLTLFDIEDTIAQLINVREMAETPEEIQAADTAIQVWVAKEVQKVDGVRQYRRFLKAVVELAAKEAVFQANRIKAAQAAIDRMDETIIGVFEQHGLNKLVGNTGNLSVQGNGGLKPLKVNEELLDGQYKRFGLWVQYDRQMDAIKLLNDAGIRNMVQAVSSPPEPDNSHIRMLLEKDVPIVGARLEERGKQVRT